MQRTPRICTIFDEFGEGVPVAWAVSNKEDTAALSLFFQQLKSQSGDLNPEYFMSDDAQQYCNAWVSTYGANNTKKLLCTWHVDRAWRKALHEHIADTASRATVYHQLQLILSEVDQIKFRALLPQFLTATMTNHCRFFEYFRGTYAKRCGEWATCHRVETIVNTNMHLESFHRLLKVVYPRQTKPSFGSPHQNHSQSIMRQKIRTTSKDTQGESISQSLRIKQASQKGRDVVTSNSPHCDHMGGEVAVKSTNCPHSAGPRRPSVCMSIDLWRVQGVYVQI